MPNILIYEANGSSPEAVKKVDVYVASLDEVSTKVGHGTYAVFRTYPGGTTFRLDRHLNRMRSSAQLLESEFTLNNHQLKQAIGQAYHKAEYPLARIKLTVPYDAPGKIIIAIEPFQPPPLPYYKRGVKVGLVPYSRNEAKAKDSRFIEERQVLKADLDEDIYEVMWYDDAGYILEGTSTNFYAVLNDTLYTAGDGVLEGIARSVVLEVTQRFLPLKLEALHISQLGDIREAMLTSSSRGVMPIVKVGDTIVGDGEVGTYYQRLAAGYHDQIERELESLSV